MQTPGNSHRKVANEASISVPQSAPAISASAGMMPTAATRRVLQSAAPLGCRSGQSLSGRYGKN
jgi:hypothetical protein